MSNFPYKWTLKDAVFAKDKGTVFSCFACGGGSTMGYKLAGFDVIGCNEIDRRMMQCYVENHKPKYSYLEDIRTFKNRADLPPELYNLDVLDGSPPCSTFSMVGQREKAWGKTKKFREGQTEQVLDTLFFDFIDLAARLQPKVVVAENVKGLILGSAKRYVVRIYDALDKAGYYCQHFLLNSSVMGVPQRRERVFFIALRKDLSIPFLSAVNLFELKPIIDMNFSEKEIPFREIMNMNGGPSNGLLKRIWSKTKEGEAPKGNSFFSYIKVHRNKPCNTITGGGKQATACLMHPVQERYLNNEEVVLASSFPTDYNYLNQRPSYLCSMSVPPVMMAQIATRIYDNWLSVINKTKKTA